MRRKGALLTTGLIALAIAGILVVASESREVPLRWIAVAAIYGAACFKLFYELEGRRRDEKI